MKALAVSVLISMATIASADSLLTLELERTNLEQCLEPRHPGAEPGRKGHTYFIQEIDVPRDTEFSMAYVLPARDEAFFIRTPPLHFLEVPSWLAPLVPGGRGGYAPWR